MERITEFESWIKETFKTQTVLAEKLGLQQARISKWIRGVEGISENFQAKFRELGYKGPWPRDEGATAYKTIPEAAAAARQPREYLVEGNIGVVAGIQVQTDPDALHLSREPFIAAYLAVDEVIGGRLSSRAKARITFLVAGVSAGLTETQIRRKVQELWELALDAQSPPQSPEQAQSPPASPAE